VVALAAPDCSGALAGGGMGVVGGGGGGYGGGGGAGGGSLPGLKPVTRTMRPRIVAETLERGVLRIRCERPLEQQDVAPLGERDTCASAAILIGEARKRMDEFGRDSSRAAYLYSA